MSELQSATRPKPLWLAGVEYVDQGKLPNADKRLAGYFTPPGIRVDIVADAPTVVNPVGMTFDDEGTPYVLEWTWSEDANTWNEVKETFRYRDGTTRQVATMKKSVRDKVKVLRDTNADGVYDKADVVLTDELPSSILVHDDWVYLTGRGTVRRFKRSRAKPGAPWVYAAKPEIVGQGFCGFHHHQVSGLTIGNDGRLYLTSGDDDNFVEGSDGSRATVIRAGGVFRSKLDGSQMEVYSIGYRNPYRDVAFDANQNMFHVDNDNEDGTKFMGCRLMHIAEGVDFGWRLKPGARCCAPDSFRGTAFGEAPGRMTPMIKTGRGAPAGLLVYEEDQLPANYRGLLVYPDVFQRLVRAYQVAPDGATYQVAHELELLKTDDPLFRPAQAVLGPDGAIYIVDWRTDSGGAGRLAGDGEHGRIYRLRAENVPLRSRGSWASITYGSDVKALTELLGSSNRSFRDRAQRRLAALGKYDELVAVLKDPKRSTAARIAALGGVQNGWNAAIEAAVVAALDDASPDLRRLAADAIGLNGAPKKPALHDALARKAADVDPKARRAVALALARIGKPGVETVLVDMLKKADPRDRYLVDGIVRALERLGEPGVEAIVALAMDPSPAVRSLGAQAFLGLRTEPAAKALPRLLPMKELTPRDRAALFGAYRNYSFEPPLDPVPAIFDFLERNPREVTEVKLAALEVITAAGGLTGRKAVHLLLGYADDPDAGLAVAAVRAIEAGRLTEAGPELANRLAGTRPAAFRAAVLRALRILGNRDALAALPSIVKGDEGTEVRIEALRLLAAIDATKANEVAEDLLKAQDPALLGEVVMALSLRPAGAKKAAREFLAGRLPPELLPQVSEGLRKHVDGGDQEIKDLLAKVLKSGLLGVDPKVIEARVAREGDPRRGRAYFLDKKVSCTSCHKLEGFGGNIGPDLTNLWHTMSTGKILEAILDPSKEIKEGFQTWIVQTTGGQTISGLRVKHTAQETVLRDSTGKETRIAAADIDSERASTTSLMPEGTVTDMARLIDLAAFLKSGKEQASLRTLALEWYVNGPYDADPKSTNAPERNPDPAGWRLERAQPDGLLDLRAVYDKDNISVYAMTRVYSPRQQRLKLLVGSDDGVRIWIDGAQVHDKIVFRGARPDEDVFDVTLREGWQTVLVRVFNGGLAHGLYLRFEDGKGVRLDPDGR